MKIYEREIIFKNTELKPIVQSTNYGHECTFETLFFGERNPEIIRGKEKNVVFSNISGTVLHRNYVEYLKIAYNNDYGIVISPNHIWFTILCSFAKIIKDDADLFKKYFTKSKKEEKTKIELKEGGENMIEIPIEKIMDLILKKLPSKIRKSLILPKISTTTPEFQLACATAFFDTCSPYYDYYFIGCGYNKIKILGTKKDYEILEKSFYNLVDKLIPDYCKFDKLDKFYKGVGDTFDRINRNYNDDKFWERILWTEAGYISQNLDGWIIPFQIFDAHYAICEYTEVTENKKNVLCTGIFSSKIDDGYLVPEFEKFIVSLE